MDDLVDWGAYGKDRMRTIRIHVIYTSSPSLVGRMSGGSQVVEQASHLHRSSQYTSKKQSHNNMRSIMIHTFSFVSDGNGFPPKLHISNSSTP